MLSRRSPKPIFSTSGPTLPTTARRPPTASNRRSMMLVRLLPRLPARPFPSRPHQPTAAFLDAHPLSQLHRRLPARYVSPSGCRRSAREKKHTAYPETEPMILHLILGSAGVHRCDHWLVFRPDFSR